MVGQLLLSFAAGLVGFLSPCVLPLLPGYVGYMSGSGTAERVSIRKALPGTLAFVAGISVVFISLGAGASVASGVLRANRRGLELVSGVFIVVLGAVMLLWALGPRIAHGLERFPVLGRATAFVERLPILLRERRIDVRPKAGPVPTFLLGAAFAFGWTPCIGPTLGAALTLAATQEGLARGIVMLAAYSAGMGLPFIAAGLGFVRFGARMKRYALTIQAVGGAVLLGVGVLILTGQLTLLTRWMQRVMGNANLDFWNI